MAVKNYCTMNGQLIGEYEGTRSTDYILDGLGSVIATFRSTGSIQNQYRYSGYGQQVYRSGTGTDPYFLWVGGWGYRTRSMVYVRRRTYYEKAAVWTSVDEFPYWMFRVTRAYLYSFVNPVTFNDPFGQFPKPETAPIKACGSGCEDPKDPCGYASKHLSDKLQKNPLGFVVCCDGKAHLCNVDTTKWPKGLRKCVGEHEQAHMPFCEKQCKARPGQISVCGPEKPGDFGREECKAYKVEIDCLDREERAECSSLPPIQLAICLHEYLKRKCSACRVINALCGKAGSESIHPRCYTLDKPCEKFNKR